MADKLITAIKIAVLVAATIVALWVMAILYVMFVLITEG